jgi:crossover junction endodeoxyribonuclease RuvC
VFVLGIDPGISRCGYGVVEQRSRTPRALALGVLRTPPADPLPKRLADLQRELRALIDEFHPDVVAVERVFFQVNVRTAMAVGQASGLAMAEAHAAGCAVAVYTPNEVKQAVAGHGAADKEQMQTMVQILLDLAAPPRPADAADAAALALCHLAHEPPSRRRAAPADRPTPTERAPGVVSS